MNTSRSAEEIYSTYIDTVYNYDFKTAVRFGGRYNISDRRIVHSVFSFVRTRSPALGIEGFTIGLTSLFLCLLTARVSFPSLIS
jgi:hypothetical protein